MNLAYLESIRQTELETVLSVLSSNRPAPCRVLEIGAGSGWQAKGLADHGYAVQAIDLANGDYSESRAWPVMDYDGETIPFADGSFDVVFSSNVLEHIPALTPFQREIQRVLTQGGIAIHLLPSASWRIWTSLAHYAFVIKASFNLFAARGGPSGKGGSDQAPLAQRIRQRSIREVAVKALFPHRHGETGNVLTEIWYFSRWRWTPFFAATGWSVKSRMTNQLFYTGYGVLASTLPMSWRQSLSRLLGSACHIYVLENGKEL